MKHYKKFLTLLIFTITLISMSAPNVLAVEDAIVAVVNDQLITLKDLKDYVTSIHTQLKMSGGHSDAEIQQIMKQVQDSAIDRLIEDRLLLNAANKYGIAANRTSVDAKIKEIRDHYPSEDAFVEALNAEGTTISQLRKTIENQLKMQFYIDNVIKPEIQVNPQEVTDFYNNNKTQFQHPESADVDSIFIPFGKDENAAHESINAAYDLISSGTAFSTVAKKYSAAPSIGIVTRGQMKPEIESKIFSLKAGTVTKPFESGQGYFILKLKKLIPQKTASLSEANEQITQFLFNQKFKEKLKSWFKEQKENAYIEIKTPQE